MTPLYVVWPARAATWSLVLMTSAGVTSEAAGTPEETFQKGQNQGLLFCTRRLPQGSGQGEGVSVCVCDCTAQCDKSRRGKL